VEATLLQLVVWLPTVGALLVAFFGHGTRARTLALVFSGVTLLLACLLYLRYDLRVGGLQAESSIPFISAIGSAFRIGIDGISMPLIFLNAFLTFLVVVVS
jgi:NADH:ubiquinone oxidoreductase subunit 4 (subunit M)